MNLRKKRADLIKWCKNTARILIYLTPAARKTNLLIRLILISGTQTKNRNGEKLRLNQIQKLKKRDRISLTLDNSSDNSSNTRLRSWSSFSTSVTNLFRLALCCWDTSSFERCVSFFWPLILIKSPDIVLSFLFSSIAFKRAKSYPLISCYQSS